MIRSGNKGGQMVVVHMDDAGKQSGWFVGMIMREVSGGYLVRVSFPREYRRPAYEVPKRKWYTRSSENAYHDDEFQTLWSGWIELPQDPGFVLFSRIASRTFLEDLRIRITGGEGNSSGIVRDCIVSVDHIFPLNAQKLLAILA